MKDIYEKTLLFDFYGELLTEHQQEVYAAVVFEDMSLREASDTFGISRQGIHDLIHRCDEILKSYEEKLQLIAQFGRLKKSLARLKKDLEKEVPKEKLLEEIEKIRTEIG